MKKGLCLALGFFAVEARASQLGPVFPTHRYPTDESFHLSYELGLANHDSNFTGALETGALLNKSSLRLVRNQFGVELQPNRQLSLGGLFNVDSLTLSEPGQAEISKTGLADQRIFAEYRFHDEVGESLGFAVVAKFAGYTNPTFQELQSAGANRAVFLGDAQSDFTGLFTSEMWWSSHFRGQMDVGITKRLDEYATEIPWRVSLAYVTPKFELSVGLRGNSTLGDDTFSGSTQNYDALHQAFVGSNYALAVNPWTLVFEPRLEVWLTPRVAAEFRFAHAWAGNRSPTFNEFGMGLTYRWAQTKVRRKRTFQQVDISTDQEAGQFQGESQRDENEPRFRDPAPIQEEPGMNEEEFN